MIIQYASRLFPKIIGYKLARHKIIKTPAPILFNFSVTNKCQSHCLTCNIWKLYKEHPEKEKQELKIWEIEKIFKSMKPVFLLNICGGEPFLREDLDEICRLACNHIKPKVIHMPTNCLAPDKINELTRRILKKIPKNVHLTVKMSIDGVGKKHDDIRGTPGNFKKVLETHDLLIKIRRKHPNLYVDAGTTVSLLNLKELKNIKTYVNKRMKLDNFLHEIADTRAELFNCEADKKKIEKAFGTVTENLKVTPTGKQYAKVANTLCKEAMKDMKGRRPLSRITQALRIVYYKRAAKVMSGKKRVVPCYAGISNCHLNPWGDLWICNVQAFKHSMGNLRDYDYDFMELWHSKTADKVRKWVAAEHCYCPLVGQAFLDTVMNPVELIKVFWYYLGGK